nr:retinoid-inducible serine carboxypeptidase-like isoform X2 [Cherax quadricarinatus]
MAAQFAVSLNKAVLQKKIRCQLAGVALGDSWVSPVDAVLSWGSYLYATSLIDSAGLTKVNNKAQEVSDAVKAGKLGPATELWGETENLIENVTNGVNFYNILKEPCRANSSNAIASHTSHIFASKNQVEMLLNTTSVKVVVYNGQLDLIVTSLGAQKWVENLHWAGTKPWVNAVRKPIDGPSGATLAFSKSFKNFAFYWVLNAGHMIPADVSDTALQMMEEIVGLKAH